MVAKEFKFQGHTMVGPCANAKLAGKGGLRPGNVARDLKRKFDRMLQDDVFWCVCVKFCNILFYSPVSFCDKIDVYIYIFFTW